MSNNDLTSNNINNNISDTLSDGPGRYPDRAVLHCCNVGVTEPRTWPSMPHFLAGEGLIQSHVRGVGKWDPIKRDPALSPHERGPFPNKQTKTTKFKISPMGALPFGPSNSK